MEFKVGSAILELIKGDITDVEADAIVKQQTPRFWAEAG